MSFVDKAINTTGDTINWATANTKKTLDVVITPERSDAIVQRYQEFSKSNPTIAAFLVTNLVFSGIPLLLFVIFSISVLLFSVITGLVLGLIGALIFTSSIVGFTLLFLVPTLLLTTIAASTLFFWAVVGLFVWTKLEQRSKR